MDPPTTASPWPPPGILHLGSHRWDQAPQGAVARPSARSRRSIAARTCTSTRCRRRRTHMPRAQSYPREQTPRARPLGWAAVPLVPPTGSLDNGLSRSSGATTDKPTEAVGGTAMLVQPQMSVVAAAATQGPSLAPPVAAAVTSLQVIGRQ